MNEFTLKSRTISIDGKKYTLGDYSMFQITLIPSYPDISGYLNYRPEYYRMELCAIQQDKTAYTELKTLNTLDRLEKLLVKHYQRRFESKSRTSKHLTISIEDEHKVQLVCSDCILTRLDTIPNLYVFNLLYYVMKLP